MIESNQSWFFLVILREIVRNQLSYSRLASSFHGIQIQSKNRADVDESMPQSLDSVTVFSSANSRFHLILRQTSIFRKSIRFVCLFPFNSELGAWPCKIVRIESYYMTIGHIKREKFDQHTFSYR